MSKTFMNKEQIVKAIASIQSRGKKLDADIQLCGLSILNHVDQHGDITLAIALYENMPKGSRRNSLALWLCKHGKLAINESPVASERKEKPLVFAKDKTTDLVAAAAEMWYEVQQEKELVEFSVIGQVRALIKKIEAASKSERGVSGLEHLPALKAIAAAGEVQESV